MDKQKAIRKTAGQESAFVDLLNQEMKELQDGMKQKQIEEMAKVIDDRVEFAKNYLGSMNKGIGYWIAEELIKHYQSKIPENSVVLTREQYEKDLAIERELGERKASRARKETAEKFADKLRYIYTDYLDGDEISVGGVRFWIDEFCKEITEG